MNKDFAVMMLFFAVSATANVGLAVAWFRSARLARRLESRLLGVGQPEDRADRFERAVESLAVQVDQLASGQEFLNRVMAERLDKLARGLPVPEPEITPH